MNISNKSFYIMIWSILIVLNGGCFSNTTALAADTSAKSDQTNQTSQTDKPVEQTKHMHFPFVHIDETRYSDGTKDVDVRAPFTKVHNPAGQDNATVKAPFTHVDHATKGTDKKAGLPPVQKEADKKKLTVGNNKSATK